MCADISTTSPLGGLYPGAACRLGYFLDSCIFRPGQPLSPSASTETGIPSGDPAMTISQASLAGSGFDPLRAIFGQYATGVGWSPPFPRTAAQPV
jgi:hypothetical protein